MFAPCVCLGEIKRELTAFPLWVGSGSLAVLCDAARQNSVVAMASQLAKPRYMSECEERLAREWYSKGVPIDDIAERLDRNKTSAWDKIGAEEQDETRGVRRKASLSEADEGKRVALTKSMIKKANVRYTVTAGMIQAKFTPKVCSRVMRKA